MRSFLPTVAFLALLTMSSAQAAETVGFRQMELADTKRPLHVSLWYPTEDVGLLVSVGENRVFYGDSVVEDAQPMSGAHPLVVLSHGYGGSWRNLSWLAAELAHQGYVVAAPDHPGTTTADRTPMQAGKLWERPHNLGRVIDALFKTASLAGPIDPERIAAIGHSLGGWTVAAVGGARFDAQQFLRDCGVNRSPRTCGLAAELGIKPDSGSPLDGDLRDARVGAIVSLDLGLARGFTPESLANFPIPALVIGAGIDIGDLPAALESGYLGVNLPLATSRYVEIADALHVTGANLVAGGIPVSCKS